MMFNPYMMMPQAKQLTVNQSADSKPAANNEKKEEAAPVQKSTPAASEQKSKPT